MIRVMVSMSGLRCSEVVAGILDDAGGIEAFVRDPRTDGPLADEAGPEVLVTDLETYSDPSRASFPAGARVLVIAPDGEDDLPVIESPLYGIIGKSAKLIELQTAVKAIANGVVLREEPGGKTAVKKTAEGCAGISISA